jgi:hypothetical protein
MRSASRAYAFAVRLSQTRLRDQLDTAPPATQREPITTPGRGNPVCSASSMAGSASAGCEPSASISTTLS